MRCTAFLHSSKLALLPSLLLTASLSTAQPQSPNWTAVDQALGRPGATQADGVRRYGFPRSDLHVVLDDVTLKPALALGGWLAFEPTGRDALVMGDLVLTADEVKPVMAELLKRGLKVTAVHNHLLRSTPQTIYMHVEARGNPARLAADLRAALARSHTPLEPSTSGTPQAALDLDSAAVDRLMGRPGKPNGGVYQFTFPRAEKIVENGMAEPSSMGTATGINFQPLGGGRSAVTGDFVLLGSEVDPVMKVLASSGIEVTALHSHMIGETPKLYFMHFWAVGPTTQLATQLRSAVDRTNARR